MTEIFKSVPHQPFDQRYSISNLGRVKVDVISPFSNSKTPFLRPGIGARGYPCVTFYFKGQKKQCFIHRMVAYAFLGNPPEGKTFVCHLDDNKLNNRADNLIWGDPYDNMRHMVEHRRSLTGSKNPKSKLDNVQVQTIRRLYREGSYSQTELAVTFGVNQTQISRVVRGAHWKHITT